MDESIPPKSKENLEFSLNKKKLLITSLIILAILLTILAIVQFSKRRNKTTLSPSPTPSASATISPVNSATATKTKTATATATPTEQPTSIDTEGAKVPAKGVLEAMLNRSLEDAKPHMTSSYYSSLSNDGFAGTSSPSRDRYEILSSQYFEGGQIYEVKAKMYMKLSGEDAGYFDITLSVISPKAGQFLVDSMTQVEHTP